MAFTSFKFKRTNVPGRIPTVSDLDFGQIAINTHSGKVYTKKNDGTTSIVEVGSNVYSEGAGISISSSNVISSTVASSGPAGRLQLSNGAGGLASLPMGTTAGQYLSYNGTSVAWLTPPITVTSVAASGGTTGLAFAGGPITSVGTLTLNGILNVANGGTGATTPAAALTNLLPTQGVGTSGQVLTSNGTNAAWVTPSPTGVTSVQATGGSTGLLFTGGPITSSGTLILSGILGLANGGTGATTPQAALTNILPPQAGNSTYILTTNGTAATWQPAPGGVSSVNASGGTTGLTFTGGPITSSGTLTLSGVLGLANGGTGTTTAAGLTALVLPVQTGQTGKYLQTDGSVSSWQNVAITPGGAPTQVQFNLGGVLAGDSGLTYNAATLTAANLTVTTLTTLAATHTVGRDTGVVIDVISSAVDTSLGNYFRKAVVGALTWTFINPPPNSRSYMFVLRIQNGGAGLQTWPASVVWPGGVAPTLSSSGVDLLFFETDNAGTSWRGASLLNYTA